MAQPVRTRGGGEQLWERCLYPLLLVVAIVVVLYSLFGIATLLGYLPLSQGGGGAKEVLRNAVEATASFDQIEDGRRVAMAGADSPCLR